MITEQTIKNVLDELVANPLPHWRIVHVGNVIPQSGGEQLRVTVILEIDR